MNVKMIKNCAFTKLKESQKIEKVDAARGQRTRYPDTLVECFTNLWDLFQIIS